MNITVQLQKIGIALTRIIPLKLTDKLAAGIGLLFCYFVPRKREYIRNNLEHIFSGEEVEPEQINHYIKRTFINFARMMTDFFRLSYMQKEDFDVERDGIENADRALAEKRGCILITAHLGNWDYAGAYLAALGVPIIALVEETDPEMFDLYTRNRERTGMKTFSIQKSAYAFLQTIRHNQLLAVLADRDIMKNGVEVDFFNGRRSIPRGLADIIIRKKIPVVFAHMVFNPTGRKHRYLGKIEPPVVFEGSVEEFNRLMVSNFEKVIRKYPDQWLVFHPEWLDQ
jgi:lauroyl/myristoyl acyltransferase